MFWRNLFVKGTFMSLDDNIDKLSQNFVNKKKKTKKQNDTKTKTKLRTAIFSLVEIVENLK